MTKNEEGPVLLTPSMALDLLREDFEAQGMSIETEGALRSIASGEAVVVPAGAGDALRGLLKDHRDSVSDYGNAFMSFVDRNLNRASAANVHCAELAWNAATARAVAWFDAALKETGRE